MVLYLIYWYWLSSNPNAMELLKENSDKIDWEMLFKENSGKIDWVMLSSNPNGNSNAIENPDKINFPNLSSNPNTINILKEKSR